MWLRWGLWVSLHSHCVLRWGVQPARDLHPLEVAGALSYVSDTQTWKHTYTLFSCCNLCLLFCSFAVWGRPGLWSLWSSLLSVVSQWSAEATFPVRHALLCRGLLLPCWHCPTWWDRLYVTESDNGFWSILADYNNLQQFRSKGNNLRVCSKAKNKTKLDSNRCVTARNKPVLFWTCTSMTVKQTHNRMSDFVGKTTKEDHVLPCHAALVWFLFLLNRKWLYIILRVSVWVGRLHVSSQNHHHSTLPELVCQSQQWWKMSWKADLNGDWFVFCFFQFLPEWCLAVWGGGLPSSPTSVSGVRVQLCCWTLHPLWVGVWQPGRLWWRFRRDLSIQLLHRPVQLHQHTKVNPN